jgi:hypothetical protein
MTVDLTEQEWNQLLNCATLAPYAQVAPLIQKIVQQLQEKSTASTETLSGNGAERLDAR